MILGRGKKALQNIKMKRKGGKGKIENLGPKREREREFDILVIKICSTELRQV